MKANKQFSLYCMCLRLHFSLFFRKLGGLYVLFLLSGCTPPLESPPPNIIFLYADDLGWTDLGVQGSDFYETPHIDRLAREGMRFTQAYANAANCAPSRACLMTGLYPPRHGIYTVNNSDRGKAIHRRVIPTPNTTTLDPTFLTLPQALQQAGYATCMAGKWHLSDDPLPYGFDTNFGGYHAGHPASYFSPYKNPNLPDGPKGEHLPARLAKDVSNWIVEHRKEPFFVYFPFYSVHTPVQAREDLAMKYENKPPGKHHNDAKQAAMIEAMDLAVGRILETLEENALEGNTLVIFTADNGPAGGQSVAKPLRGSKGMYYEGGIREPLLIKWPGVIVPSTVTDVPVIGTDFFPTLTEVARAPQPDSLDGVSLVPLLKGEIANLSERPLFWHFPAYLQMGKNDRAFEDSHDKPHLRTSPCSVIRYGDWKLIEYFETGALELYNLAEDLSEKKNLAETQPEKREELHALLRQWRANTQAPEPTEANPAFVESP